MNTVTTTNAYTGYITYFLGYVIVLISIVLYFTSSDNSKAFNYSTIGFMIMTFVVLGITIYYFYPSMKNKSTDLTITYIMAALITFASTISWIFLTIDQKNLQSLGTIFFFMSIVAVIIGLAILFYIFGDYFKQRRGIVGLIINFIFFIPCLLLDFVEFIKRELSMTTKTEYILLLCEIVLIIGYFFAVRLINSSLESSTVYLLKNPVFLNKQTVLLNNATSLSVQKDANSSLNTGTTTNSFYNYIDASSHLYSSNFAISLWLYLNVQTREFTTDKGDAYEATIFSYGSGKPKMKYTNDIYDTNNRDKINFYFTDSAMTPNYQKTIPSQKWNNIVFNYSSNKVDLFINGNLETTFYFDEKNKRPVYVETDNITTGQNNQGIYGAICNVIYYKSNMLNSEIVNDYNFLMLKNPPIAQI